MAIGDFGAVLDSVTFHQVEGQPPNLRKRTNNIAVLLTQASATGHATLRSIAIDDAGDIDPTPIDTFALHLSTCRDMGLIHFLDDVFAVYANDHVSNGLLWTVGCDDAGDIADPYLDFIVLGKASNAARRSDLIKPHDGILLTGPCIPFVGVHAQTIAITDAGIMPATPADSMALPVQPKIQRLRQGGGDRIVDLSSGLTQYHIDTYTCTNAGALPAAVTDSWGPIACAIDPKSLCKISNTVYAALVKDSDGTLQIHTFSINADGTINKAWIDSEQVEAVMGIHLHMKEMGGGYFVVAYTMITPYWRLKTYFIAADGTIQTGAIDSLDMMSGNRGNPWFEHLNGNIWTLTYEEVIQEIRIDTIGIETLSPNSTHNELMVGIGP